MKQVQLKTPSWTNENFLFIWNLNVIKFLFQGGPCRNHSSFAEQRSGNKHTFREQWWYTSHSGLLERYSCQKKLVIVFFVCVYGKFPAGKSCEIWEIWVQLNNHGLPIFLANQDYWKREGRRNIESLSFWDQDDLYAIMCLTITKISIWTRRVTPCTLVNFWFLVSNLHWVEM